MSEESLVLETTYEEVTIDETPDLETPIEESPTQEETVQETPTEEVRERISALELNMLRQAENRVAKARQDVLNAEGAMSVVLESIYTLRGLAPTTLITREGVIESAQKAEDGNKEG